jgi:Transposase
MVHRRFSHHPLLTRPTRASEARPFQALRAPVTSNLRRTPACSSHPGLSRLDRARRFPHSGQRTAASFNPAYVRPAIAPPAQIAPRASHNPPDSRCLRTDSHSSFNPSNRGHLELLLDVAVRPTGETLIFKRTGAGIQDLIARLGALSPKMAAIEATGGFEAMVAAGLAGAGLPVVVVNPAQVRAFAQALGKRAKTDTCSMRR